ncbi:cytochrome C biogenesis protein [candidate division KSB1 bacterium]|nr:cytochrome C biogenesis protein [candidate division KSB1 bacterium]
MQRMSTGYFNLLKKTSSSVSSDRSLMAKIGLTFMTKSFIFLSMKKAKLLKILLLFWMMLIIIASFLYAKAAVGFPGETSRIMIYHVPQAWVATLAFFISMIASILYLSKRRLNADHIAVTAAELGFLFSILATVSGSIFAKVTWGSYWNWDPRETSIVILLMIYGAYFALRSAVPDPERKRVFSAAYAILAFATVPFLVFVIPRITMSLHPEDTMNPVDPQLDSRFMTVFLGAMVAYSGLFGWMFNLKYRLLKIEEKIYKGLEEWEMD